MTKVSIIIPVHNTEQYLQRCFDSCLQQTIDSFEIIAVDDCSSDSSPSIIADYVAKHPDRFQAIFLEKNIRQGGARNRGIIAAKGEYLAFVDSDDWIEPDMCEKLFSAANGADMVGASYYISTDNEDRPVPLYYSTCAFTEASRLEYMQNCGMFWTRLYSRRFLIESSLIFPENIFYEDAYFNCMTALYANCVVHIDGFFYHYYQAASSTVRTRNAPRLYDRISIADLIWEDSLQRGIFQAHRGCIEYKFLSMMASNVLYTCLQAFDVPDRGQLKRISSSVRAKFKSLRRSHAYVLLSPTLRRYLWLVTHSISAAVAYYKLKLENVFYYSGLLFRKLKSKVMPK